jgi:ketopantoate reductase
MFSCCFNAANVVRAKKESQSHQLASSSTRAAACAASADAVATKSGTAKVNTDDDGKRTNVLIIGDGRLGTWLAVQFALCTTTARDSNHSSSNNRYDKMNVYLKARKREARDSSRSASKEPGEYLIKKHDVRRIESYEDTNDDNSIDRATEKKKKKKKKNEYYFDYVFVTVKTYAFESVKREIDESGVKIGTAVMLHNGIVKPLFEDVYENGKYIPCVIPQSYDFVKVEDEEGAFEIHVKNAEKPWAMADTAASREVHELLKSIGANSKPDEDFEYTLLRKYFINCVANLLSIVGNCNCDGLLDTPLLMQRMERLYSEMFVALEQSHEKGFAKMPKDFKAVVFDGLRSYGKHFPSTKLDFDSGAPLEIDSLNGYVCLRARENNAPCIEHELLIEEVKNLVKLRDAKDRNQ